MNAVKVSLTDELAELAAVLESAEMLADLFATESMPDKRAANRTPRLLAAIIGLAHNRVRLLRKVVLHQADASLLLSRRNLRDRIKKCEDPDVLLPVRRRR